MALVFVFEHDGRLGGQEGTKESLFIGFGIIRIRHEQNLTIHNCKTDSVTVKIPIKKEMRL